MSRESDIPSLCRIRHRQHQLEARNEARQMSEAIRRSVAPLSDDDAQRPFMVPGGHNPYHMWNCIIKKVSHPQAIQTLWNASPLFQEILTRNAQECKYVEAMFPLIVQIILQKRPQYLLDENFQRRRQGKVSLSKMTLLNLRFISTLCKSSAEELLHVDDSTKLYLRLETCNKVENIINDLSKSEEKNRPTSAAFYPRNVEVDENGILYRNLEARTRFSELILKFFELAGKRIVTLRYTSDGTSSEEIYENLMAWVQCMPNLENLELSTDPDRLFYNLRHLEDLPSFPHCPKLKAFIQIQRKVPEAYVQEIIRMNPQIIFLAQPRYLPAEKYMHPIKMNLNLKHLERLHTPVYPLLIKYFQFQIPLKQFVFMQSDELGRAEYPARGLFVFLNQFRDSLEHLELIFVNSNGDGRGSYLDLPNLKFFKWRYYSKTFKDMRFLMHAERLEVVHMDVHSPEIQTVVGRRIFLGGFFQAVTQGFDGLDIWRVFPKLREYVTNFEQVRETMTCFRHQNFP